jgi:cytidylate kinase
MKYLDFIRVELLKAVRDENVVYHGLAGNLLLYDVPHLLGIRVIAGMEYRIEAAMERTNLMRNEAVDFIESIDNKRDKLVKYLYNVDSNDPSLYSLVINLDNMDIESASEVICINASQKEYQRTAESQKRLNDLILAAEVKARIASDDNIKNGHIRIDAFDGLVTLSGNVNFIKDADRIRVVTLDTPGVRDIDSRMRVSTITQAIGQF